MVDSSQNIRKSGKAISNLNGQRIELDRTKRMKSTHTSKYPIQCNGTLMDHMKSP